MIVLNKAFTQFINLKGEGGTFIFSSLSHSVTDARPASLYTQVSRLQRYFKWLLSLLGYSMLKVYHVLKTGHVKSIPRLTNTCYLYFLYQLKFFINFSLFITGKCLFIIFFTVKKLKKCSFCIWKSLKITF